MAENQLSQARDTHSVIRGRPHQRTMERVAFNAWVEDFAHENQVSSATRVWFVHRFYDELDRRRAMEHKWRKIFWSTRYVILSGSLILPAIITASTSILWLNPVGILVSTLVALATGVEVLLRTGPKWRLYRLGADRISIEGAAFFQMIGLYAVPDPADRLLLFKERIENLTNEFQESYLADVDAMVSQNVIGPSPTRRNE